MIAARSVKIKVIDRRAVGSSGSGWACSVLCAHCSVLGTVLAHASSAAAAAASSQFLSLRKSDKTSMHATAASTARSRLTSVRCRRFRIYPPVCRHSSVRSEGLLQLRFGFDSTPTTNEHVHFFRRVERRRTLVVNT